MSVPKKKTGEKLVLWSRGRDGLTVEGLPFVVHCYGDGHTDETSCIAIAFQAFEGI